MTIRKAGKIVRLLDSALETAKRTQIRLMEAQIEVPREDTEIATSMIDTVDAQTKLVEHLQNLAVAVDELHEELQQALDAEKE